ncbi:LysR family transcriptional regulator [Caproicibacterium sp. NSD3]
MTLLQLSYFVEICRAESFTRAAEVQHVTQPTMTNVVKDLETEFGIRLLDRSNKAVLLTSAGKEFLEMAISLLDYADHIKMIMLDKSEQNRRLLLGIPNMTNAACFTELFGVIHKAYPDIEIDTTHNMTANLLHLLDAGKLHLLMVPYQPSDIKYCHLIWKKTRFLFCVSKDHPLASKKMLSIHDICDEPIISYFGDAYLKNFNLMEKYRANGHEMKIVYRCNQINIMQELIQKNIGCGFLIENSFSKESGIVGIPIDESLSVTIYLIWTRESARLSVVQKSLRCIRTYLGNPPLKK